MTVVAVLGRGVVPADTPVLRADDLAAVRGDGVFETIHLRSGLLWQLDAHLDRMVRSAGKLEIALPPRADLAALALETAAAWPADQEGALRLACSRGTESGGPSTVWT